MYTLIGNPGTRAFRVLWALEEIGLEYEIKSVMPHSDDILMVNPGGKLPALMVDSEVVVDSLAIMQFLADRHTALTHPAGTLQRARQDSFSQFFCDELDSACWLMAKHSFVLPRELRQKAAVRPALDWDVRRALKTLEARVGNGPWLAGELFTVADILLVHCSEWMGKCGFDAPAGKTAELIERIKARPAYASAVDIRKQHET